MKSKIILAILTIACASVAYGYEPCGVYEETVQPCAPIETVQPCAPVQTAIEPCSPVQTCEPVATIEPCAPVVGYAECAEFVCDSCPCRLARVASRRNVVERRVSIETSVGQKRCCLARIFARKNVAIERKVKIETN